MKNQYIALLTEQAALDANLVGSKAMYLAKLLQAGFPVPYGFVVTTYAFERFLSANIFVPNISQESVIAASFPKDIVEALKDTFTKLGKISVAVRSSAIAEDLPGASFAG